MKTRSKGSLTTKEGTPARVERREAEWWVVEPVDAPADQLEVESMLSTLVNLSSQGLIEQPQEASVYGLEVAESMLELVSHVEEERTDYPFVWGLISPPSVDRANRSYQSLYVNRRWVQIRSLGFALEQAYHGFLMERRYPLAVVNVSISPEEVDVNVHPAKTEVRFRRENQVFAALQLVIETAARSSAAGRESDQTARKCNY